MRLYICEKPSLAEALANNLGNPKRKNGSFFVGEDVVTPLRGHIMEMLSPNEYDETFKKWSYSTLPIIPNIFKKKVKENQGYPEIFKRIKELIPQASEIINVGDPDREGQLLVDEVLEKLNCKLPCKRLLINALDDITIQRALAAMDDNANYYTQYLAALGRERTDWLIGMNATRKFSLDYGQVLRIGRVKIPTLSLVYHRNEEIDNFKSQDYYTVSTYFRTENSMPFSSHWIIPDELLDSENHLLNIVPARACEQKCKSKNGYVKSVLSKKGKINPPLPYSLSTLQKESGPKLGFSPSKVLEIAQSLYEKKFITYPRSDSNYLPESQFNDAAEIIDHLKLTGSEELQRLADCANSSIKHACFNTQKIEAHHALIPTMEQCDLDKLSSDEKALYILISTRYLLQFYPPQEFETTDILIDCESELFKATGKVIITEGWKAAYTSDDEEKDANERRLPFLKEGDILTMSSFEIQTKATKPPARFTQSTLIGALTTAHKFVKDKTLAEKVKEVKGLGTEATRATMISELLKSGELIEHGSNKKKELFVSDAIKELIPFLPDKITYPDMTALMELDLDRIAKGELTLDNFIKEQVAFVQELINIKTNFSKPLNRENEYPTCPICHDGKLFPHDGKYGKFWSCSNYKNGCKASFTDNKNKPILVKCPKCKNGYLKKWAGKKGDYYQCPNCKEFYSVLKSGLPKLSNKRETKS